MEKEKQIQILQLLAENEKKVSQLYGVYAEKFPEQYDFWSLLANDEIAHAEWIWALYDSLRSSAKDLEEDRFSVQEIKLFSDCLDQKIQEAGQEDLTLAKALGAALDIEKALMENKWFEFFAQDPVEVKTSFERLKAALVKHKAKIAEALDSIKPAP